MNGHRTGNDLSSVVVRASPGKGNGLFAARDIKVP